MAANDTTSTPTQIKDRLAAVRSARQKAAADLIAAQKALLHAHKIVAHEGVKGIKQELARKLGAAIAWRRDQAGDGAGRGAATAAQD